MAARRIRRVVRAATALLTCGLLLAGCGASEPPPDGAVLDTAPPDLGAAQVFSNQVYARRPSGPLALDLFLPEAPGPRPLVVYAHGGGWDAGNRKIDGALPAAGAAESLAAERLLREGFAVATVDYRLTGVARAPAQVEDVADAVRWLQGRAGTWRLDAEHVVLWGASAGGLLVSQLGAATDQPGGLAGIRGVVNWFGPTDLTAAAQVANPELGDYPRHMVRKYLGCMPVDCPRHADAASPARNLSGREPPFLLQHGTKDALVPIAQSLDFVAELRRLGGEAALHPYDAFDHGFTPSPAVPVIVDAMADFLTRRR